MTGSPTFSLDSITQAWETTLLNATEDSIKVLSRTLAWLNFSMISTPHSNLGESDLLLELLQDLLDWVLHYAPKPSGEPGKPHHVKLYSEEGGNEPIGILFVQSVKRIYR